MDENQSPKTATLHIPPNSQGHCSELIDANSEPCCDEIRDKANLYCHEVKGSDDGEDISFLGPPDDLLWDNYDTESSAAYDDLAPIGEISEPESETEFEDVEDISREPCESEDTCSTCISVEDILPCQGCEACLAPSPYTS